MDFEILGAVAAVIGIGAAFLKWPKLSLFGTKSEKVEKDIPEADEELLESFEPPPENHSNDVADRLQQLLVMLRTKHEALTVPELANWLGFDDANPLENILNRIGSPEFALLDEIATKLGVSPNWLKFGLSEPFSVRLPRAYDPRGYINLIKKEQPKEVFLIRSSCKTGYASIVFRYDKFRYLVSPSGIHVSDKVGGTGTRQLWEFYRFIEILRDDFNHGDKLDVHISGRTLDEEDYLSLVRGEVYPGLVLGKQYFECHWWDDLTDIYHEHAIAEGGYLVYGEPFVAAQATIRSYIEFLKSRETP